MKVAVVTFVYPSAIKYLHDFIKCLQTQNFKEFELLIFNDGVSNLAEAINSFELPFKNIEVSGTPTQVRFSAFKWLGSSDYDKIIFQDIDDLMSSNRVKCLVSLLDSYEIVANDLSLMNEDAKIYADSIWRDKLGDLFEFDYKFISKKNILGIGNSAARKKIFEVAIKQNSIPLVADWFMYYQVLKNGNLKAVFTTQCQTYYRQHADNMAGVKELSEERLNYVIKVKEAQYNALQEVGEAVEKEMQLLIEQKKNINQILNSNKNQSHFFWWDETTIQ